MDGWMDGWMIGLSRVLDSDTLRIRRGLTDEKVPHKVNVSFSDGVVQLKFPPAKYHHERDV
jgi:hypothetical protein